MTRPFATRQLPFFLTAPTPCPYLEGRMERKIFTRVDNDQTAHLNNILTHAGFRRSQSILYRPACELCSACKSARIPVADFEPSRTHAGCPGGMRTSCVWRVRPKPCPSSSRF